MCHMEWVGDFLSSGDWRRSASLISGDTALGWREFEPDNFVSNCLTSSLVSAFDISLCKSIVFFLLFSPTLWMRIFLFITAPEMFPRVSIVEVNQNSELIMWKNELYNLKHG